MSHQTTIRRRDFLRLGGAVLGAGHSVRSWGAPATPPNVLFIVTDQQHYDTIAAAGCDYVQTPAMNSLVRRGTRFSHSYSANPLCSPARSSLFTGRPSSETGVHKNGLSIRKAIPNLGQWLAREADYECVYAGKWHVPNTHTMFIPGFSVLTTALGGQGNLGDTFTSRACAAYLRNRPTRKPFFMVASFMQPHDICEWLRLNSTHLDRLPYPELADELPPLPDNFDYDPREPAVVSARRKGNEALQNNWTKEHWRYYIWSYYRHVEMVDAEIGRVLDALAGSGQANNTLVVFTSDHGEGAGHHQTTRKNCLYDEAARVPLAFSLSGRIAEGRMCSSRVVSGLDIAPTICSFAGVAAPPNVRGWDLRRLLEGGAAPGGEACVAEVQTNSGRMVRTLETKYITYKDDPVEQLFDMTDDPGETRNLADDPGSADMLKDHRKILLDWEQRLDVAPGVAARDYWRGPRT